MKIIDLLNKIANGEEVPKYIYYTGKIWGNDNYDDYITEGDDNDTYLFMEEMPTCNIKTFLNDEVEIIGEEEIKEKVIEEEKKIPYLEFTKDGIGFWLKDGLVEEPKKIEEIYPLNNESDEFRILADKINEIIDFLNQGGKE